MLAHTTKRKQEESYKLLPHFLYPHASNNNKNNAKLDNEIEYIHKKRNKKTATAENSLGSVRQDAVNCNLCYTNSAFNLYSAFNVWRFVKLGL